MRDNFSVEYEMTDDLAAQLTRAVLADRRYFLQMAQGTGLLLFVLMVLLFWPAILVVRDQLSPPVLVVIIAALAIGFWVMLRILVHRYAHWATLLPFLGQSTRTIQLHFSDDHIGVEVSGVTGDRSWKDVERIEIFATLWLFRLRPAGHFALPVSILSPDLESFLRRKAIEAGFPIHD
jgi:hypothetical protein